MLRNQANDIESFKGLSQTLNTFLFEQAEKHNENEMKLGIAEVLNGNLTVKPEYIQKFQEDLGQLASAAVGEAEFSDQVADNVSPIVAAQHRTTSPALKGWRAYGNAIGKSKKAAAGAQMFLQEFMESDQEVVPLQGEDGTPRLLRPRDARTPGEIAAALAVGQQMMVDQYGLHAINPLLIAEHVTPTVMAIRESIMANRVAEARKEMQAEAIEEVHTRIGSEVLLLNDQDPNSIQTFWQETTLALRINGGMKQGEANETVIKSFIEHVDATGRRELLQALAATPLIADQPNGPTVGDRFRPLFERANRTIDAYEDSLREKAEKEQDDAADDLLSAHQLLLTTPGVTPDQVSSSWAATTEGLRALASQGSKRAINSLGSLMQQGENYNPFLAADLARDIANGIYHDPAQIDELVRLGRISSQEASSIKDRLPSSASAEKAKGMKPEIKRLVQGLFKAQFAEGGINPTDAASVFALLEGQMTDELTTALQQILIRNPDMSDGEMRDFIQKQSTALAASPRFRVELDDKTGMPKAPNLDTSNRVLRFTNPTTGQQLQDFSRATPAQVQSSRPVASRDYLINPQELAQNQQSYLQGGAPTPRVRALMAATGKDWQTFLRDQSKAYGTPFTQMSQANAAKAAQQRRSLAPGAAAVLTNPNATAQQRVRAWNDINAARTRASQREAWDSSGKTTGPIDFNAAYNALVGKESGGDPSVLNRSGSGATGLGQVMPENIGPWTERWLGRRMTQEEFRRNPEAQRRVVTAQFRQNINDQIAAGHSPEVALRRAAAIWYSGRPELHTSTKPQSWNGNRYPSVKEYADDIVRRYNSNRQGSFSGARGGRANFTPQNVQSVRIETPGPNFQPGMDLWFADKNFGAVLPGKVKEIRMNNGNYGNMIVVESMDPATGDKVDVVYAHLDSIGVREGERIRPGTIIGRQGGTGRVRSADGTIASVDFLSPAPRGSNSMTPYRGWQQLSSRIKQQIESGTFR
jgi:hypothetical protein